MRRASATRFARAQSSGRRYHFELADAFVVDPRTGIWIDVE
jgi:hypothetical protein